MKRPWIGFFFSDLVEALENLLLLFFGNPNARILDAYDGIVLVFCDVYQYQVYLWRIFITGFKSTKGLTEALDSSSLMLILG